MEALELLYPFDGTIDQARPSSLGEFLACNRSVEAAATTAPSGSGASTTAGSAVKRPGDVAAEYGGRVRVRRRGPRADDELAVDDLGDLGIGDLHQVLVGRAPLRRPHRRDDSTTMR